jgi:hypothetical protein
LRGFSIGYDKALAGQVDRLVIAIANGFEPFPSGAIQAASATVAVPVRSAAVVATPAVLATIKPQDRLASGIVLDAATLITSAKAVADCKSLSVGFTRVSGKIIASDAQLGVALIKVEARLALPPARFATSDSPWVALGYGWSGQVAALSYAEATGNADLKAVSVPLQAGGAGAALITARGEIAGVITDDPGQRRMIAGVVPSGRYAAVSARDVAAFMARHGVAATAASVSAAGGDTKRDAPSASLLKDTIVPVFCGI